MTRRRHHPWAAHRDPGLSKHFGPVLAVDDLSFTVEPGRVTGFLGPNGSGKTTTLRMLLGLVHPSAGTATIAGRNYQDLDNPTSTVGAVLEATSFHPARRARTHLRMAARAGGHDEKRADEVLGLVGLTGDAKRKIGGFSMGMRQRLELATALIGDPDVLILDEPSNGLDPQGIAWLRDFMRYLAGEGRTVLVSSHLLSEMAQTIDDAVIVSFGQLKAQGTLDEITAGITGVVMRARTPEADRLAGVLTQAGIAFRRLTARRGRHGRRDARAGRAAAGLEPDHPLRAGPGGRRPRVGLPLADRPGWASATWRPPVINALRAELLKMRTMPGVWVTFGLALPLTVLGILIVFAVRRRASRATPSTSSRRCSQRRRAPRARATSAIEILAPIIGVLCITSEYRQKTITTSLVLVPVRSRVLLAKVIATALWSIFIALLGLVAIGRRGAALERRPRRCRPSQVTDQVGAVIPGLLASAVLLGLFGLGFGTLVKNQVAGHPADHRRARSSSRGSSSRWPGPSSTTTSTGSPTAAGAALAGDIARGFGGGGGGAAANGPNAFRLLAWWQGGLVLLAWGLVPADPRLLHDVPPRRHLTGRAHRSRSPPAAA